jgi:formylglycine-generating enzyme required for sulfatase activity
MTMMMPGLTWRLGRLMLGAAVWALVVALPLVSAQNKKGRGTQYAFLVACSRYDKKELRELPYTANDIAGFREALLATGFEAENIKVLDDKHSNHRYFPEKIKMLRELALLIEGLRPDDTLVVALSGHGVHFKGDNAGYFCPIDAKLDDKKSLIPMEGEGGLFEILKHCKARQKLLIVNACRNDPVSNLAQAARKVDLDDEDSDVVPEGIAALYSCKAGQKCCFDPDRQRGIFFDHLIRAWKGEYQKGDDALKLEDVFHEVVRKTKTDADRTLAAAQVPEVRREYKGEWIIRAERVRPKMLDCTGEQGVSAADVRRAQKVWAKYLGRSVEETIEIADGVKMTFVSVPPGKILMGSLEDEQERVAEEETLHEVTITEPFDLAVTEVTQRKYEALIGTNPSNFKGADRPVEMVSWEDARDYAAQLTKKRQDRHVYLLPTEAQWEYSCRGGRGNSRPFGIGDGRALSSLQANFGGNDPYGGADSGPNRAATCDVHSFPGNALGLFDIHGNVWEWCADWHGPYGAGAVINPTGPAEGLGRVLRGASWYNVGANCRAANRHWMEPGTRNEGMGFRLARTPPSASK